MLCRLGKKKKKNGSFATAVNCLNTQVRKPCHRSSDPGSLWEGLEFPVVNHHSQDNRLSSQAWHCGLSWDVRVPA